MNFEAARSFIEVMFSSIGQSVLAPSFEMDMVMIVSNVAKEMLVEFHEECHKQATIDELLDVETIPKFGRKLEAICWILKTLLRAQVAEQVVECFMHLELYPKILEGAIGSSSLTYNAHAIEFASLVLLIHREAIAGNVVMKVPERIALLENWNLIYSFHELSKKHKLLCESGFDQAKDSEVLGLSFEKQEELVIQAREDVFLTLPFQQQMELIQSGIRPNHPPFITPISLARLVKQKWLNFAVENAHEDASSDQIL